MKQISVAAYMGAKYRLAPQLVKYFVYKNASRYVDMFGGMGNLILNKPPHSVEIYNDLDPDLYILFMVLSNEKSRYFLIKNLLTLAYDEDTYYQAKILTSDINNVFRLGPTVYASYVWFLLMSSLNGMRGTGFRGVNEKINEPIFKKG